METTDLDELVAPLARRDWRIVRAASETLVAAGDAGLEAVLGGLNDPQPRVRRGCLDWLDHFGSTLCIGELRRLALNDPVPDVRRAALHAFACVRCKPDPLDDSGLEFVSAIALHDPNRKVRRTAVCQLSEQPVSARAAETLRAVLEIETEYDIRRPAHLALRHHSPDYRRLTDQRARDLSTSASASTT